MRRAATILSVVFNPLAYVSLYLAALLGAHGLGWLGAVAVVWLMLAGVPAGLLLIGRRLGLWSDLDLTHLRERRTYMPWVLLSAALCTVWALAGRFPPDLRFSVVAILLWLAVSTGVGLVWKISLHVGGAAGIAWMSGLIFGLTVGLALGLVVVALAWARLDLGRHTLSQVVGGAAAGTASVLAVLWVVQIV